MLQHNAGLTASHPYASDPINWPFDLTGISFWTENDLKMQVYAIGNVAGWWICVLGLSVFVGVIGADQLARRRGIEPIEDREYSSFLASAFTVWSSFRTSPRENEELTRVLLLLRLSLLPPRPFLSPSLLPLPRPPKPTLQQLRLLRHRLGLPLLPLLPHVASTLHPSLPPRSPRLRLRRRISSQLHPHGIHQLPRLDRWTDDEAET